MLDSWTLSGAHCALVSHLLQKILLLSLALVLLASAHLRRPLSLETFRLSSKMVNDHWSYNEPHRLWVVVILRNAQFTVSGNLELFADLQNSDRHPQLARPEMVVWFLSS